VNIERPQMKFGETELPPTMVADAQLFKKGGFKKFKSKMALIDSF